MEYAIAHHQFQKARFYSNEERRERDNLGLLQEKRRRFDEQEIIRRSHEGDTPHAEAES
jgi:hypothetical protein